MPFFLIFCFFSWTLVQGAALTENALKEAKKVVVLTGNFDPWTEQNEKTAREFLQSGSADLVVVVPTNIHSTDTPLPVRNRLELMHASLKNDRQIVYPLGDFESSAENATELTHRLQSINTRTKVVSVSSSEGINISKWMSEHPDQYFGAERITPSGISPQVYEKIVEDGLYLGRSSRSRTIVGSTLSFIVNETTKFGVYDKVRAVAVRLTARPNLREFQMDGNNVKIKKYLASGLTGDAYVAEVDSVQTVLKISKDSEAARKSMREAALVHAWLRRTSQIILPELRGMGSQGEWQALELVKGEPLDKFIARNGGRIPPETEKQLKNLFDEASKLNRKSAIKLDISADNIFIRSSDGAAVLVDFGPIRPEDLFAANYSVAKDRWLTAAGFPVPHRIPSGNDCELRALESLLSH